MMELFEANWPAFVAVLLLGLLVAWWIWGRRPAERIRTETDDVLTPGAAPAERNAVLVDAPPATAAMTAPLAAAVAPPSASVGMDGLGEVIAAADTREIADVAAAEAAPGADRPQDIQALAPGSGGPDDLTRIKGIGPKLNSMLTQLGVTRYDQIAAWTPEDAAAIDQRLGPFQGRIVRDNWIEQCRYLASDDTAGFEAKFGKV